MATTPKTTHKACFRGRPRRPGSAAVAEMMRTRPQAHSKRARVMSVRSQRFSSGKSPACAMLLAVLVEVFQHAFRDGGRAQTALAAVLHEDGDGHLRAFDRRETDEDRVVLALGILGRAGLSRHREPVHAGARGGAAG